jgi:hypothetical protein
MAVEVGVWYAFFFRSAPLSTRFRSCVVDPKKGLTVEPPAAIRITNIALGDVLANASARTTLKLTYKYTYLSFLALFLTFCAAALSKTRRTVKNSN